MGGNRFSKRVYLGGGGGGGCNEYHPTRAAGGRNYGAVGGVNRDQPPGIGAANTGGGGGGGSGGSGSSDISNGGNGGSGVITIRMHLKIA